MIVLKHLGRGCMRFRAIEQNRKLRRLSRVQHPRTRVTSNLGRPRNIITKREIAELLFETCIDCTRMAAIPQGAFAACKVRCNLERNTLITPMEERERSGKENIFNARPPLEAVGRELTPLQYNSKLMNSIWGLYNRYSVHNFKKNTDGNEGAFETFVAVFGTIFGNHPPAANTVTAAAVTKNNVQ